MSTHSTVAISAPGKVLLAGGYLVLDRQYTGVVFGLSARINVIATEIRTGDGIQLNEIVVGSPQFLEAQWRYGYHMMPEGGGIGVTQLQTARFVPKNPFVEETLTYALTYISTVIARQSDQQITPAHLTILADDDYYSQSSTTSPRSPADGRFSHFAVPLSAANKTGLGSSAALVTSLTGALLSHYLPQASFNLNTDKGRRTLHNLSQAAHCAAQGKVGSGFDVAAAVYGSCRYKRFSPSVLSNVPEPGVAGFAKALVSVVQEQEGREWDVEVQKDWVSVPPGVSLRMCDVDCGSQTVGMVKKVLAWRERDATQSKQLWDDLQSRNDALAVTLKSGDTSELPQRLKAARNLIKQMGQLSDVPIEPDSQSELLDAMGAIDGVYGGVVPGAGGFDAVAVLMENDEETLSRVESFLEDWSRKRNSKVRLLNVRGEMDGAKEENLDIYSGWFRYEL